jgi:hypothetical protein
MTRKDSFELGQLQHEQEFENSVHQVHTKFHEPKYRAFR